MKLGTKTRKRIRDPLAGQREAINAGNGSSLFWDAPSEKTPCPVEVGEFFPLRSCGIEITRKERVRDNGEWKWRADFVRIRKAEPELLMKRGGGTTTDPDLAMNSFDDLQDAATIDAISPEDRSEAHKAAGEPPEGAIVPHEVVRELRPSREAQQRYAREVGEARIAEDALPLSERMRRLEESGVDLSRQFARIRDGVGAAEAKRRRLESKSPSDRAA